MSCEEGGHDNIDVVDDGAAHLIGELFHVDDLSPQNFQQAFFSVRGVLIAAAQKVECEDFLKDQTGKSFTEYVEELRLSRAMELLRGSELGITEISVQCGFSTQNTFYKAFRRRFGISPSAVRRGDNAG